MISTINITKEDDNMTDDTQQTDTGTDAQQTDDVDLMGQDVPDDEREDLQRGMADGGEEEEDSEGDSE